jgi:hypothetical protein
MGTDYGVIDADMNIVVQRGRLMMHREERHAGMRLSREEMGPVYNGRVDYCRSPDSSSIMAEEISEDFGKTLGKLIGSDCFSFLSELIRKQDHLLSLRSQGKYGNEKTGKGVI